MIQLPDTQPMNLICVLRGFAIIDSMEVAYIASNKWCTHYSKAKHKKKTILLLITFINLKISKKNFKICAKKTYFSKLVTENLLNLLTTNANLDQRF